MGNPISSKLRSNLLTRKPDNAGAPRKISILPVLTMLKGGIWSWRIIETTQCDVDRKEQAFRQKP